MKYFFDVKLPLNYRKLIYKQLNIQINSHLFDYDFYLSYIIPKAYNKDTFS